MAEKIVMPLNIDGLIGKVKNRIELVGVELEGGWKQLPPGVPALERDGSVFNGRPPVGIPHIGELPIGPVMPASIKSLLTKNYPHKINSTCGMHVHMSFSTLWYYGLLMVPEYQETMLEYLKRWATEQNFKESHYIWPRLRGESRFCQKGFWPDAQAGTKRKNFDHESPGHRYTVIHYCGRQNTIECRVLPMMNNPQLALKAIQHVIDITNACIFVLGKGKKPPQWSGKLELPNGITYEESIEARV